MNKLIAQLSICMALAASLLSTTLQADEPAGQVIAVKGEVMAQTRGGSVRTLRKSDSVFVGETLVTGTGSYAVVEFVDGAKATMRPESSLVLSKYAFGTDDDGAVLELVKGGFRAITGEIANGKPDAYKVQTNVATLGVRGTEFAIRICDSKCAEEHRDHAQITEGLTGHGYIVVN